MSSFEPTRWQGVFKCGPFFYEHHEGKYLLLTLAQMERIRKGAAKLRSKPRRAPAKAEKPEPEAVKPPPPPNEPAPETVSRTMPPPWKATPLRPLPPVPEPPIERKDLDIGIPISEVREPRRPDCTTFVDGEPKAAPSPPEAFLAHVDQVVDIVKAEASGLPVDKKGLGDHHVEWILHVLREDVRRLRAEDTETGAAMAVASVRRRLCEAAPSGYVRFGRAR